MQGVVWILTLPLHLLVVLKMRLKSHDGCEEHAQVIVAEEPVVDCQNPPMVQERTVSS
jgi:hypothetical protein